MGWLSDRRRIKRQIVRMNTPWIDRAKDAAFMWFMLLCAIVILVLLVRGRVNGAW